MRVTGQHQQLGTLTQKHLGTEWHAVLYYWIFLVRCVFYGLHLRTLHNKCIPPENTFFIMLILKRHSKFERAGWSPLLGLGD